MLSIAWCLWYVSLRALMSRKLVLLLVTNRRCPNKVTNVAKLGVGDKGSSFLVAQGTSPPGQSAVRHTSLLLLL